MQVERIEVSKLTGDPANARKHGERNIQTIVESLNRFGQQKPIVVDSSFCVRAGNGTLEAARSLGWTHLDCVVTDLKGSDAIAYAIADNRTAELAEWDSGVLAATLEGLQLDDEALLTAAGFSEGELKELLADIELSGDGTTGEIVEDEVPDTPVVPITKPGDLWLLGRHRVLCGDSTKAEDVERLTGVVKPFIMVTDPPYGVEYESEKGRVTNDDRFDWTDSYKLFSGDVAYVWHGERTSLDVGVNLRSVGFDVRGRVVWVKPSLTMGRGHYHFQHEGAWYAVRASRTSKWAGDCKQSTVWKIDREDHAHPTVKPVECMSRPIRNHGGKDDDVYDPFLGSGTTLIAAEQLNRTCYGMEISPQYCDVIVNRWEKLTGKKAVLDGNTGHANDVESNTAAVADQAGVSGRDNKATNPNRRKPKKQPA